VFAPRIRSAILVAFALAAWAPSGRAGDLARARKIFAEGVRLFRAGDWEGARRLFHEADAEHHAPTIVYNIGLAEEKLGHPQAAVDLYEAYIAESGESGEFAASAAAAIAQIKAHSTRLRIETVPPGGRLFVDGTALEEQAPTTVLVSAGHHVVVAQATDWRDEHTVEVRGSGDVLPVLFQRPDPAAPEAPPSESVPPAQRDPPRDPQQDVGDSRPLARLDVGAPDAFVWGAAFAMVPMYLFGVTDTGAQNKTPAASFLAGPLLEVGYALTDRFEFLARGLVGIGPDAKPSYGYLGGPGVSIRALSWLWMGGTFLGGQIETAAHNGVNYGTGLVFGGMLETSAAVIRKNHGEWLVGVQPSMLLTQVHKSNTALFLPLSFGYRAY
jgi:hypothetical protein